jgi:PTH2 family peptidyl-tRNA hydrolase
MRPVKQVIIMRKDLNMRKGKMVAQGAHASMAAVLNQAQNQDMYRDSIVLNLYDDTLPLRDRYTVEHPLRTWINGSFTKVCVSVDSEIELLQLLALAHASDIPQALIRDNGLTEFNGVPTNTCGAIGPWWSDEIDKITGHLKLL